MKKIKIGSLVKDRAPGPVRYFGVVTQVHHYITSVWCRVRWNNGTTGMVRDRRLEVVAEP